MRRLGPILLAFILHAGTVQAQEGEAGDEAEVQAQAEEPSAPVHVPWYLPRAAFVGAFIQRNAIIPQLRIQWSATLIKNRNDSLVAMIEGGGGFGLSLPQNIQPYALGSMTSYYEHLAMIGLGYDAVYRTGWSWGFQVLTGAQWYGARFQELPTENALGGTVEGRLNVGLDVGPFRLMASGGWAQLWVTPRSSVAAQYAGGPIFGVYVNWRPVETRK